jgi:hypothetical protein
MQSWRQRCEKCVRLQGDYVEKWLHFQLPRMSIFLNKLGDLRTWMHHVHCLQYFPQHYKEFGLSNRDRLFSVLAWQNLDLWIFGSKQWCGSMSYILRFV